MQRVNKNKVQVLIFINWTMQTLRRLSKLIFARSSESTRRDRYHPRIDSLQLAHYEKLDERSVSRDPVNGVVARGQTTADGLFAEGREPNNGLWTAKDLLRGAELELDSFWPPLESVGLSRAGNLFSLHQRSERGQMRIIVIDA